MYSGRGRPPKAMKGMGMMVIPRETGGGDSSNDEEEAGQAAGCVEAEEMDVDEDKEYSEEETDEEVSIIIIIIFKHLFLVDCSIVCIKYIHNWDILKTGHQEDLS